METWDEIMTDVNSINDDLTNSNAGPIKEPTNNPCGNLIWFGQYEEINLKPE